MRGYPGKGWPRRVMSGVIKTIRPSPGSSIAAFPRIACAIVGIGLNESMKFACNPSNPPCGAQRALHVGRRRVGGPSNLKPRPQLENLALRHQLRVLRSSVKRPKLTSADRLLWAWLSGFCSDTLCGTSRSPSRINLIQPGAPFLWREPGCARQYVCDHEQSAPEREQETEWLPPPLRSVPTAQRSTPR